MERKTTGTCDLCRRPKMSLSFHHLIPQTLHANAWFRYNNSSNSSNSAPNRYIAVSTASGFSMSTPASRSRSSGYFEHPPLRKFK